MSPSLKGLFFLCSLTHAHIPVFIQLTASTPIDEVLTILMTEIKHDRFIEVEETSLAIDCLQFPGEEWHSNFSFLQNTCTVFL